MRREIYTEMRRRRDDTRCLGVFLGVYLGVCFAQPADGTDGSDAPMKRRSMEVLVYKATPRCS